MENGRPRTVLKMRFGSNRGLNPRNLLDISLSERECVILQMEVHIQRKLAHYATSHMGQGCKLEPENLIRQFNWERIKI